MSINLRFRILTTNGLSKFGDVSSSNKTIQAKSFSSQRESIFTPSLSKNLIYHLVCLFKIYSKEKLLAKFFDWNGLARIDHRGHGWARIKRGLDAVAGRMGRRKNKPLQASLREFRFFLANPALRDHPCHLSSLPLVSPPILPIRVNPCNPWLNKILKIRMIIFLS